MGAVLSYIVRRRHTLVLACDPKRCLAPLGGQPDATTSVAARLAPTDVAELVALAAVAAVAVVVVAAGATLVVLPPTAAVVALAATWHGWPRH